MPIVDHSINVVEVDKVSFSYGGEDVLKDITFSIHRGDYLGLVGSNGAGKTTLLKIILGLLKPSSGSVKLFGTPIEKFKEWAKIGYVPQKANAFDVNFPATVEEVVLMSRFGRSSLGSKISKLDKEKALEALRHVEMEKFRSRLIGDLSGGQQQRVFIARALANEPEIIFLDEPTVGIEQAVKQEFYSLLKKMNKDLGLTVVLVTHDLDSISTEAMHIACVDKRLFFHDSIDGYFKDTHEAHHH